jgi:membrane protein DedA with SNARE-associated domain
VALGAFLAGRGILNAWAVFTITWTANVGGAACVYGLARRHGRAFFQSPMGRKLLSPAVLVHVERAYERHGTYGIFFSRLLPIWRAVVAPFAGIAGLSPARTLVPVALASGLWYGALTLLVVRLGTNLEIVLAQLEKVNRGLAIGAMVVLVLLAAAVAIVWRRTKRP